MGKKQAVYNKFDEYLNQKNNSGKSNSNQIFNNNRQRRDKQAKNPKNNHAGKGDDAKPQIIKIPKSAIFEQYKTIRFTLSPNETKKNKVVASELESLVGVSMEMVQSQIQEKSKSLEIKDQETAIKKINEILGSLKNFTSSWLTFSERTDTIKLSEEYYRFVARKARFNSFEQYKDKYGKEKTTPQIKSGFIPLNQKSEYQGIERSEYVIKYWQNLANNIVNLHSQLEAPVDKYITALEKQDKAHTKVNLIQLKKTFLSFSNLILEYLEPLTNNKILIEKIDKLPDSEENTKLKEFFSNQNINLIRQDLQSLKQVIDYFNQNGALVSLGKVSLNYHTAVKKPDIVKSEIETIINELELETFIKKYIQCDDQELFKKFQFDIADKKQVFLCNKNDLTKIELAQLFKPRPIPFGVIHEISEYFEKKDFDYNNVQNILMNTGQSVNIAGDWTNTKLEDRENFDLNKYPLKSAFDYAWEYTARNKVGLIGNNDFAKKQSEKLLTDFDVKTSDNNFESYANLLFIGDKLAVLEHSAHEIKDKKELENIMILISQKIENVKNPFHQNSEKDRYEKFENNCETISSSLNSSHTLKSNKNFQKAKQNLGLVRGGLKNKGIYYKLTQQFGINKTIDNKLSLASFLGLKFADLNKKFKEKYENNKIGYYGVIVEENINKYLLLKALENEDTREIIENDKILKSEKFENALTVKKVTSLTSNSLKKIRINKKAYPDFHLEKIDEEKTSKEDNKALKESKRANYIKRCLLKSKMSQEQNWNQKFNWENDLNECQTYEQIEKVLDLKGYKLETKHISKNDLENLVTEQDCLLLPIINQDYQSEIKQGEFVGNKNQFTVDFENVFVNKPIENKQDKKTYNYRIHPEFSLFYQLPTIKPETGQTEQDLQKEHHAKTLNRNSRFQIIGNFGIEIKPEITEFSQFGNFINRKGKNDLTRDKQSYAEFVQGFNQKISSDFEQKDSNRQWIYGFDRGINELATLCVLHKNSKQIDDFVVFKKEKEKEKKLGWIGEIIEEKKKSGKELEKKDKFVFRFVKHDESKNQKGFELQHILDLTNIKVETWHFGFKDKDGNDHPNDKYLKTALSKIKENSELFEIAKKLGYFDNFSEGKRGENIKILVQYPENESNVIKLRMNHFQRVLSFAISQNRDGVANSIEEVFESDVEAEQVKKLFDNGILDNTKIKIDIDKHINLFKPLLDQIKEWNENKDKPNYLDEFKKKYEEIEDLDTLKKGIVANMVGVTGFLMEKLPGVLVLEDTYKYDPQGFRINSLTKRDENADTFGHSEHLTWAGTETYRYFEKMLVKKFVKQRLVPPFADLESLNTQKTKLGGNEDENNKQFGIMFYVDAGFTSKTCPCCGFKPDFKNENLKNLLEKTTSIQKINHNYCLSDCKDNILFELKN
jgi:hypothetical protein